MSAFVQPGVGKAPQPKFSLRPAVASSVAIDRDHHTPDGRRTPAGIVRTVAYDPPPAGRHVLVSPHFDDAVLGCADLLVQAGPAVTVVTVCGAPPPEELPVSGWDAACGFASGADAARTRADEDDAACARVRAAPRRLRFADGAYGGPPSEAEVRAAVADLLPDDATLWVPAAIGGQPDHRARPLPCLAARAARRGVPRSEPPRRPAGHGGQLGPPGRSRPAVVATVPTMSTALEQPPAVEPAVPAAVRLHLAAGASAFTRQLTTALAAALGGEAVEGLPAPFDVRRHGSAPPAVVIAPHEFLAGRPLADRSALARAVEGAVVVSTVDESEHLGGAVTPLLEPAALVLDPAAAGVAALGRVGARAGDLPLGVVPGGPAPRRRWRDRPLEAATWALATTHRLHALSSCASVLADRDTRVDLRQALPAPAHEQPLDHEPTAAELGSTRVLLWVPAGRGRALPWRVVVSAVAAGAVVVAEQPAEPGPLEPGTHLVACAAPSLPLLLDALLRDPQAAERMADEAHAVLEAERPWGATVAAVQEAVAEAAGRGPAPRRPRAPADDPVPHPAPATAADEAGSPGRDDAVLRRLLLDVAALRRELRRLGGRAGTESARWSTPAWPSAEAEVSVVITLHDYAETVVDALDSVVGSVGVAPEIVVVDDASEDDSVSVARAWLDAHPDVPATLVARPVNAGVAAARNAGVEVARGPFVLTLDADDALYRHGIARLRRALTADPGAAFAYGIVEQGDEAGSYGLLGYGPWDPERLRVGNYITSIALLRRTTLERVGGWDDRHPLLLTAWEDYDLWLRCAAAGLHGAHVPEVVAWYRQGPSSRDRLSEVVAPAVTTLLRRRYPAVFGASAGTHEEET
jgi:GT2 family glycosyltransferase